MRAVYYCYLFVDCFLFVVNVRSVVIEGRRVVRPRAYWLCVCTSNAHGWSNMSSAQCSNEIPVEYFITGHKGVLCHATTLTTPSPDPVLLPQPSASRFLGLLGCRRSHTARTVC